MSDISGNLYEFTIQSADGPSLKNLLHKQLWFKIMIKGSYLVIFDRLPVRLSDNKNQPEASILDKRPVTNTL